MFTTQSWSSPTGCDTVENAFTMHATTNITVGTTSLYTVAFTGTVGVEMTGVVVYPILVGTGGTITAYLQEYNGTAWADVAGGVEGFTTITTTSLQGYSPVYLRYNASYTCATATAGYYRIRFVNTGATGTTTFAANSAGTAIAYLATNNVNTTTKPASTNNVIVAGNKYAAITLTMDGTQLIGAGLASTGSSTEIVGIRPTGGLKALMVGYGATIQDDTAANVDFTIKGDLILYQGSKSYRGTTGTPYSSSRVSIYRFDEGTTGVSAGMIKANTAVKEWVGMVKTGTSVTPRYYVSGVGTAEDPMITTGDIGGVNDEVIVNATDDDADNYLHCEHRFIKTKNSATSYVLSTAVGGAEAALTYTHTTSAKIFNIESNVKVTTNSSSYGWFYQNWETTNRANDISKDCQFEYVGGGTAYRQAYFVTNTVGGVGTIDYCKFVRRIGIGLSFRSGSTSGYTYTGNIVCGGVSTNTVAGINFEGTANITCNDFVLADEKRISISSNGAANIVFNRLEMNACGKDGGVTGTLYLTGGIYGWLFNDSNFNACRGQAVYYSSAACNFFRSNFGTEGKNGTDVSVVGLNSGLFYNCNFGSDTLISGYLSQSIGSVIKFHKMDGLDYKHRWYTPYGWACCTNSEQTDTTETAALHNCVRIASEDATTGFTWEFQVPTFVAFSGNILAYLQRNATFNAAAGSVTVEVWLDGSTVADATYTMGTTTGVWEVATAAKTYSSTIPTMSTIKIISKTTTSGAYLYIGDLFGGTNNVTDLSIWNNGQPSVVQFDQIGNPGAVWAQLTNTFTTAGTAGKSLSDIEVETKNFLTL